MAILAGTQLGSWAAGAAWNELEESDAGERGRKCQSEQGKEGRGRGWGASAVARSAERRRLSHAWRVE
eukprot:726903-Rhodomonas_salina.1